MDGSESKGVVALLYDALNRHDAEAVHRILSPDLEMWFHGPPPYQFLMRLLTGDQHSNFCFTPISIAAFGPLVLVEGLDASRSVAWVHAWTMSADGIITQVREYFNTSLTVTRVANSNEDCAIVPLDCPSIWESSLPNRVGKSVPGLILAI